MSYTLILDLVVAGLLVAAMIYMVRLNRRLEALRAGREEFETLVKRFTAATAQAQGNVAAMKAAADSTGRNLQEEIDQARVLREDLAFLADRANGLADQLEAAITRARPAAAAAPAAAATSDAAGPATGFGGSNVARMPSRGDEALVAGTSVAGTRAAAPRPAAPRPAAPPAGGLSNSENELLRRLSTLR